MITTCDVMLFAPKVFSRANKYGEKDSENVSRVHKEADYIADLINLYTRPVSVISNTQQLKRNVVQMSHTFSS